MMDKPAVRGSNHKTLVKNKGDDASTGAGGVIVMHKDTVPEKRPYLLQAEALLGLLQATEMKVEMINRMAHLTPVRTYRSMAASGVAIETEFQDFEYAPGREGGAACVDGESVGQDFLPVGGGGL